MSTTERLGLLRKGLMIPASPLALTDDGSFSPAYQRALYRYYAAAGCGGVAVGVHTTQFEIREPEIGLFEPVLELAAEELKACEERRRSTLLRIAGVCGRTEQALGEAALARRLDYDAVLLSLAAWKDADEDSILTHCRVVAEQIPVIGFYLQPAVGGRLLSADFWRAFALIENVVAIKIAPFNRYQTLDVIRGVALAGAKDRITLYTGNDDNIIADLITPFPVVLPNGERVVLRIKGGLLGQYSIYARTLVKLLTHIHKLIDSGDDYPPELLARNVELTDINAVIFDAAHQFRGCIPGINEVLRRQRLLPSNRCLNPAEQLSSGQAEELTRIEKDYPWLSDEEFIRGHLDEWLEA